LDQHFSFQVKGLRALPFGYVAMGDQTEGWK